MIRIFILVEWISKTAQNISLRLNVPIDEVLYMPIGQEILFRRGQRPIITRRYDIQKDELYKRITNDYNRNEITQDI